MRVAVKSKGRDYSSMALRVDTQSTTQAAKKLFNMMVSNFMAVLR